MLRVTVPAFLLYVLLVLGTSSVGAQIPVDLGDGAEATYYPGTSHIALVFVHRTADFRVHWSIPEWVARGFHVLGIKTRWANSGTVIPQDSDEALVDWEFIALDVRAGVRFLRSQPTITRVVLIGHSGGGPTTSYYQAVAENGASFCQMPNKLTKCTDAQMRGWRDSDKADGIVFVEAHSGNPMNTLFKLNAAVTNENDPDNLDPNLDPFSEANGYNPDGDSAYSQEFVDAYSRGQSRRMNKLILEALETRKETEQGKRDPADNGFVFHRNSARLQQISTGVLCCTSKPRRLLRDDGTISDPHIIRTVRRPDPGQQEADAQSTVNLTVTSFLSANAIRASHSQDRIDWCSSNNSTVCAVRHISVPIVVIPGQAHYFIWDGEQIYENSASIDKTFIVSEGMGHGLLPSASYPNAARNLWDFVRDWVNTRF